MDRRAATGWRALSARLALRRRLMVAVLTGIAVVCGLTALQPPRPATLRVWVAARDLPGGAPLASADVTVERIPTPDVPSDALGAGTTVVGRLLAAPMRRGEPLTDVRLLSPSLLSATATPDDLAVPVRVADGPATLALVHAGDLIDVIAAPDPADGGAPSTFTVVHDVLVLSTPTHDSDDSSSDDSAGLLIVAATDRQAAALAKAATGARLSIAVRRDLGHTAADR
jgi:Flp pilus assembly protein CpaB